MNTNLLFLVLVLPLGIFKATTAVETTTATTTCCPTKIISGDGDSRSGTYTFNTTMDVSTLPAECKDGCIYSKMGLDELFCFAPGNLTSKCVVFTLTAISFAVNPWFPKVVGSYPCTNEITTSYNFDSVFVVLDEEIISCGGIDKSGVSGSCLVWRNNTWQTFPSLNQGRIAFAMNTYQDTIVASGGVNVTRVGSTSSMEIYNKTAGKWEELSVGLSFARSSHCAVDIGGKMLILGGEKGKTDVSTVEQYTINLDTSKAINETKANMFFARSSMGCTVFENNVYVFGLSEKTIDIYDVATDVWKQLPATLNDDGSRYRNLVNLNGALYIFGIKTQVYKEGNWSFVNDSTISQASPFNMVVAPLPCEN